MSYPKNYPGGAQIQIGIIGGGDVTDPAQDHSCNQRVYSPLEHSPDGVKLKHLALSPMKHSPTQHSQQSFPGALDPGSLVYVLKTTGQNQVSIIGQANDLHNSKASPGNIDLMQSNPIVQELMNRTIQVLVPPEVQEGVERGAKVRKIKEKGEEHRHSLLKGLPTHGALFNMTGYRLPQVQEVPTALQEFQQILTQDMLGQIMGMASQAMSLGSMFGGLNNTGGGMGGGGGAGAGLGSSQPTNDYQGTGSVGSANGQFSVSYLTTTANTEYNNAIKKTGGPAWEKVPQVGIDGIGNDIEAQTEFLQMVVNPGSRMENIMGVLADKPNAQELQDAIKNLAILTQSNLSGPQNCGSYCSGDFLHLETYLDHAERMLSEVNSIDDIMLALTELNSNTELFGQDVLNQTISFAGNTAVGNVIQSVTMSGNVQVQRSQSMQQQIKSMENMMSSASGSPSAQGGGSMFANQGKNLMDMLKRVSPEGMKNGMDVIQTINKGQLPESMSKITDMVISKGGNPLDFKIWS